jgi:tRNA(Ile2) C34 agmatinyltransferase TiaS
MRDFMILMLVLAFITGMLWISHIWIPDMMTKWRPKCFPKCDERVMEPLPYGGFRCRKCGWIKRVDARRKVI